MPYSLQRRLLNITRVSAFFLKFPNAVAELEITVAGKQIPEFFHELEDKLRQEISESKIADNTHSQVQKDSKQLLNTLHTTARQLENIINSMLNLTGEEKGFIHLQHVRTNLQEYKEFLQQVDEVTAKVEIGEFLKKKVEEFRSHLAAYEKNLSKIGSSEKAKVAEAGDVEEVIQREYIRASGLMALCREFLRSRDREVYREFCK